MKFNGMRSGILGLLCILVILGSVIAVNATVITQHYEFTQPVIESTGDYQRINMNGTWTHGEPGLPALPMFGARILLPAGEEIVDIEVVMGELVPVAGFFSVQPGQRQYPISLTGPQIPDEPNGDIYSSNRAYPYDPNDAAQTGLFHGYNIATFAIHPVQYQPVTGELAWYRDCVVKVTTAFSEQVRQASERFIRHDDATLARLNTMVDNVGANTSYLGLQRQSAGDRSLDPADGFKYLIITTDSWANYMEDFADFQSGRGHKAGIFRKDWILSNYAGADEQEAIRNFIIDAENSWDCDYVLLVGDSNSATGILHRGLFAEAYGTTDTDIPADLYFGCLDGNWNADGDGRWGEPGEEDYYPEVGVGRACVSTVEDLQHWLTKQTRYVTAPVMAEADKALLVGELLWDDPTWGGDYMEEIRLGASTHGYTTVGFPDRMDVDTLYDMDQTWSASQLIDIMNSGMNIICHLGHCNTDYMMKFYIPSVQDMTADGIDHTYNFVYSQGCFPGAFDANCIGEEMNCLEFGAVALVINSRYGWGEHLSTDGSSQYFNRQFFDAMFGEEIYALADANSDSKVDNVWSISYGANRWVYYELNLFGDPAMHLWTGTPENLIVDAPSEVTIGMPSISINVGGVLNAPLENAIVTVWTDDMSVYSSGLTDPFGAVELPIAAEAPGIMHIQVVAHDFLAWNGTTTIIPPSGPYLVLDSATVLDADGDNDGNLDEAETVTLELRLENVGVEGTSGISAVLTCADPFIAIIDDSAVFPDIPAGGFGTSQGLMSVQVAGDIPDGHLVPFELVMTSADGSWNGSFSFVAEAPLLTAGEIAVNDSQGGDADGTADPGESMFLALTLGNTGHSAAENLNGILSCSDSQVSIHQASANCAQVSVDGEGTIAYFEIEIASDLPAPVILPLQLDLTAAGGFSSTLEFGLAVGGWLDTFENDHGWTIGAPDDDASTGHWTRVEPIGTTYGDPVQQVQPEDDHSADPGSLCFVTGNGSVGGTAGANDVDGGKTTLLTPVFDLSQASEAVISYWRWYTENLGNNPNEEYWVVDVTNNGVDWVHLENTLVSDNSWTQFTFDLTEYITLTDNVQIRFIAQDQGSGTLVEAAVDDFLMDATFPILTAIPGEEAAPQRAALGPNFPNPFNPKTTIQFDLPATGMVKLMVFDVTGRRVRTLLDGKAVMGHHEIVWDGRDATGHQVASGLYFTRLIMSESTLTRKMMLLK
ncbi:MAG: hypothetical protein GY835_01680 [bacterium]|nr:hypothetical protein [bacterium]